MNNSNSNSNGNAVCKSRPIRLNNVSTGASNVDTLHQAAFENVHCEPKQCMGALMRHVTSGAARHRRTPEEILCHAKNFFDQYYTSIKRLNSPVHAERWSQVKASIAKHGTYQLKETELIFGAKLAWRNASRCIGRIQWSKLQIFDVRSVSTAKDMFDAICNHIKYATNKGNLRSAITIFPQRTDSGDFRIWNQQLISYAGYPDPDRPGHIIGDPINVEFTQVCLNLGWKPARTNWDVLPIIVSAPGQDPQIFNLPEELVLRVPIEHSTLKWFKDLNLQWYAVPAQSNMLFDVGGIEFPAAPFSGWYMVTEIACRDLCDPNRYNILKTVADKMGLDTRSNMTLWKDAALVEVTRAVIDSYHKLGVTIVDHHTAAESFMKHLENEQRLRGGCPADWVWIVPPTAGSLTPVFHQEMIDYRLKPSFEYQEPAWKSHSWNVSPNGEKSIVQGRKKKFKEIARAVKFTSNLFGKALSKRVKATILYATETGRSEEYAKRLEQIFSFAFNVTVMCMDSYDIFQLEHETLLLIVTSTFGNGDPPENGESFAKQLQAIKVTGDTTPDIESVSIHNGNSLELEKLKLETDVNNSKMILEEGKLMNGDNEFNENKKPQKTVISKSETSLQSNGHFTSYQAYKQFCRSKRRRFAVFGLGSSAYPNFCAFAKYLDNMLGELGGERIFKLVNGDELCGQEQSFNQWSKDVFAEACNVFCLSDEINMNDVMKTATLKPKIWSVQSVKLVPSTDPLQGPKSTMETVKALTKSSNRKAIPFRLVSTVALHKGGDKQRQTIRVILELDQQYQNKWLGDQTLPSSAKLASTPVTVTTNHSASKQQVYDQQQQNGHITVIPSKNQPQPPQETKVPLTYSPGDHLGIFPENSPLLVKGIISRLNKIDFTTVYSIMVRKSGDDSVTGSADEYVPHEKLPACSIEEALVRYLDITTPPTQQLLSLLTPFCKDNGQKSLMERLANDSERYEEWKAHHYPNLLELLTQFDSLDPPAEIILTQLPILQPRFYSISSSNKYYTCTTPSSTSTSSSSSTSLLSSNNNNNNNTINNLNSNNNNNNKMNNNSNNNISSSHSSSSSSVNLSTNGHSPISSTDNSSSSFLIDPSSVVDITGSPRRPGSLYKESTLSLFSLLSKFTGFETSNHTSNNHNNHHHHYNAANNNTNYLNNYNDNNTSSSLMRVNNNNNNNNVIMKEETNDSSKHIIVNKQQATMESLKDEAKKTSHNNDETVSISCEGNSVRIDLTVAVVSYTTASGAQHFGVCSNFLANIKDGHQVYGFLRSAPNFRMPDDHSVPIIMVGPGTGIAPFRAFWLERFAEGMKNPSVKSNFGKMSLYFGCRLPFMELYSDETRHMVKEKILSDVKVAYSRVAGQPKRYVQDELRSSAKEVLHQLMKEKGHLYVCGDVSMAEGVSQTLRTLLSEAGYEDPDGVIMYLRSDNRYHEDIFGITLRTDEVRRKGRDNALNRKITSTV